MRAKKYLGQHFLRSAKALKAIVGAANLAKEDSVVEIGPGEGVLTEKLLALGNRVTALEKDRGLCEKIGQKFADQITKGDLRIVCTDALKSNWAEEVGNFPWVLVGNIPYYITGALIKKSFEQNPLPKRVIFLVQKEVAERVVGKKEKESILSLSVKAYGSPRIVMTVPRGAFSPAPEVDSAIIAVENVSRNFFKEITEKDFFSIVRKGFSAKRKLLFRNLGLPPALAEKIFREADIPVSARAEDVPVEKWQKLTERLKTQGPSTDFSHSAYR